MCLTEEADGRYGEAGRGTGRGCAAIGLHRPEGGLAALERWHGNRRLWLSLPWCPFAPLSPPDRRAELRPA
jgi:hypothetical protein